MKIAVIDVGSNSVRLAMVSDGKTIYKRLATTRLGEGLSVTGKLSAEAIARTVAAVANLSAEAQKDGADKVYAFATAAVRSAPNGYEFVEKLKKDCGIQAEVLSGETEARCGVLGALQGKDGGIIDVGGASTEIILQKGGKTVYSESIDIGTVRLHDLAGRDREKLERVIEEKLSAYKNIKSHGSEFCAIGGTATRLAAIKHGLKEYNPQITHGTVLTTDLLEKYSNALLTAPIEEIRANSICKNSADIVGGGCFLLYSVVKKLCLSKVTVSESDNLEGYLALKEGNI